MKTPVRGLGTVEPIKLNNETLIAYFSYLIKFMWLTLIVSQPQRACNKHSVLFPDQWLLSYPRPVRPPGGRVLWHGQWGLLRGRSGVLHLLRDSLRHRQDPALQTKVQAGLRPGDASLLLSQEKARIRGELNLVSFFHFHPSLSIKLHVYVCMCICVCAIGHFGKFESIRFPNLHIVNLMLIYN